ncbi:uncharacterized protein, partial [Hetaerina americana]|uniref:uncharacterized protein n=1 Tax=Hetaerina americana TaxID=62018 RepID=UPI003A7F4A9F
VIPHGSVASDSRECSQIGASILKKGGNAVDAAIATTICLGVVLPHLTGIGGGGFIAIYDHRRHHVVDAIDFREQAPLKVKPDAHGNVSITQETTKGVGSTVGIPGFLKGLGFAHELYGRLPWADLIKPTIDLCSSGFLVPSNLIAARSQLPASTNENFRENNTLFWEHFGSLEAGRDMTDLKMASTLQAVADEGPKALYNGTLTSDLIKTITASGGTITQEDLIGYTPIRRPLLRVPFGPSSWVYSMGSPTGGPLLLSALTLIDAAYQNSAYQVGTEPVVMLNDTTDAPITSADVSDRPQENISSTTEEYQASITVSDLTTEGQNGKTVVDKSGSMEEPLKESSMSVDSKNLDGKVVPDTGKSFFVTSQDQDPKEGHLSKFQKSTGKGVVGKATVVPYELKKKRRRRRLVGLSGEEQDFGQGLKGTTKDSTEEMTVLLKALKDASLLHSLLGDPSNPGCANDDYDIATNPVEKLKMLRMKMTSSEESVLLQNIPESLRSAGSNVAVVDADELYVSVVSGLSSWFGSQILTSRGYLLNDALTNFAQNEENLLPLHLLGFPMSPSPDPHSQQLPSPTPLTSSLKSKMAATPNHKASQSLREERISKRNVDEKSSMHTCNDYGSGRRPLSSSVVAFVVPRKEGGKELSDNGSEEGVGACGQRIVLGSADALSVVQVLVQIILKGSSLVEGIEYTRMKPLPAPFNYGIEVGPESSKWGDDVSKETTALKATPLPQPYASVNGIEEVVDTLASHADSRGGGVAARF